MVVLVPICGLLYRMGRERPWTMLLSAAMGVAIITTIFFLDVK